MKKKIEMILRLFMYAKFESLCAILYVDNARHKLDEITS